MRGLTTQLIRQLSAAADHRTDGDLIGGFLTNHSETDFAELVRRHGPMVWGICRRSLPDRTDAEDAFQTVFLVLVRRGNKLTGLTTLGPWLHRVAVWTGRNIRRRNAHRLSKRAVLTEELPVDATDRDLPLDLDDALLALPEKFRSSIVLCHLQGFSRADAAAQLGCPEGTLSAWLSRGLAKLRTKLGDRDPARILGVAAVAVPAGLSGSVVRAAVASHATAVMSSVLSSAVPQLVEGVIRMFWVKKATAATVALFAVFAFGIGVGVSTHQLAPAVGGQESAAFQKLGIPLEAPQGSNIAAKEREFDKSETDIDSVLADLEKQLAQLNKLYRALQDKITYLQEKMALDAQQKQIDPKVTQQNLDMLAQLKDQARATAKSLDELKNTMKVLRDYKDHQDQTTPQKNKLKVKDDEEKSADPKNKFGQKYEDPQPKTPGLKAPPVVVSDDLDKKLAELKRLQADLRAKLEIEAANSKLKEAALQAEMKRVQEALATLLKQKEQGAKLPPATKGSGAYFQLTVGTKDATWPFQIKEYGSDGKLIGTTAFENSSVLGRFLARAMKDSAAPKEVKITAQANMSSEMLASAIEACKTAGVAQPLLSKNFTLPAQDGAHDALMQWLKSNPFPVQEGADDALMQWLKVQEREAEKAKFKKLFDEGTADKLKLEALKRAEMEKTYRDALRKAEELLKQKAEQLQKPEKP